MMMSDEIGILVWLISSVTTAHGCLSDDVMFSKNGITCRSVNGEANRMLCYDPDVQAACCYTCSIINTGESSCPYGDRMICLPFFCSTYEFPERDCCLTCRESASTSSSTSSSSASLSLSSQTTTAHVKTTTSECIDDPLFTKDIHSCVSLVEFSRAECYDPAVETACCQSCLQVSTDIAGCRYGDRISCSRYLCATFQLAEADCCDTCRDLGPSPTSSKAPITSTPSVSLPTTTGIKVSTAERVGQCEDDPLFSKNGMTCDNLIRESTIQECYNADVEEACCLSCSQVNIGIPGCPYGDRMVCIQFLCSTYENPDRDCCLTCRDSSSSSSSSTSSSTSSSSSLSTIVSRPQSTLPRKLTSGTDKTTSKVTETTTETTSGTILTTTTVTSVSTPGETTTDSHETTTKDQESKTSEPSTRSITTIDETTGSAVPTTVAETTSINQTTTSDRTTTFPLTSYTPNKTTRYPFSTHSVTSISSTIFTSTMDISTSDSLTSSTEVIHSSTTGTTNSSEVGTTSPENVTVPEVTTLLPWTSTYIVTGETTSTLKSTTTVYPVSEIAINETTSSEQNTTISSKMITDKTSGNTLPTSTDIYETTEDETTISLFSSITTERNVANVTWTTLFVTDTSKMSSYSTANRHLSTRKSTRPHFSSQISRQTTSGPNISSASMSSTVKTANNTTTKEASDDVIIAGKANKHHEGILSSTLCAVLFVLLGLIIVVILVASKRRQRKRTIYISRERSSECYMVSYVGRPVAFSKLHGGYFQRNELFMYNTSVKVKRDTLSRSAEHVEEGLIHNRSEFSKLPAYEYIGIGVRTAYHNIQDLYGSVPSVPMYR